MQGEVLVLHTSMAGMLGLDTFYWCVTFIHIFQGHVLFGHFPTLICWFCTHCAEVLHLCTLTCHADWHMTRPKRPTREWRRGQKWKWGQEQWRWVSFVQMQGEVFVLCTSHGKVLVLHPSVKHWDWTHSTLMCYIHTHLQMSCLVWTLPNMLILHTLCCSITFMYPNMSCWLAHDQTQVKNKGTHRGMEKGPMRAVTIKVRVLFLDPRWLVFVLYTSHEEMSVLHTHCWDVGPGHIVPSCHITHINNCCVCFEHFMLILNTLHWSITSMQPNMPCWLEHQINILNKGNHMEVEGLGLEMAVTEVGMAKVRVIFLGARGGVCFAHSKWRGVSPAHNHGWDVGPRHILHIFMSICFGHFPIPTCCHCTHCALMLDWHIHFKPGQFEHLTTSTCSS
jgi:hypothetical protein